MLPRRFSTEIWIRNSGDESLLPHGVEETKRATTGGRPYGVGTSCAPFCPSFSAKSHVCECLVFINAHIYAFAALPTFHGGSRTQKRREKIKTGSGTQNGRPLGVAPTASGQAALRSDFRNENQSHAPLSLLFREKSRLRMLGVYKCTHNAFAALPTFHGIYGERTSVRKKGKDYYVSFKKH